MPDNHKTQSFLMERDDVYNAINDLVQMIPKSKAPDIHRALTYVNISLKHPLRRKEDFDDNGNLNAYVIYGMFDAPAVQSFPSLLINYAEKNPETLDEIRMVVDKYANFVIQSKQWADDVQKSQIVCSRPEKISE